MRTKVLGFLSIVVLLSIWAPVLNAEESSTNFGVITVPSLATVAPEETKVVPKKYKLGGSLAIDTASTVNPADPIDVSGSYVGTISYKKMVADTSDQVEYTASLSVGYMRSYSYEGGSVNTIYGGELSEGKAGDFVDPRAKISKSFREVGPLDSVGIAVTGGLGGLSRSSEKSTWIGSLGASVSYTKGLGAFTEKLKKFEISQALMASYGFYNYKTRNDGRINKPFSMMLNNGLAYEFGSGWSASTSLILIQQINFRNTVAYMTSVGFEVGYQPHEKVSLGLGVSTSSGLLAPNGIDYQFIVYRPDAAIGYLSAVISI